MAALRKAGRRCLTCDHRLRVEIDRALVLQTAPLASLSRTYGISTDALRSHRDGHISEEQKRALVVDRKREVAADIDAEINTDVVDIRSGLARIVAEVERILNRAKANGDDGMALASLRDMRATLLDLAKVYGQLKDVSTIQVEVGATPQWALLRQILIETFRDHPAALPTFIAKARPLRLALPQA